MHLSRAMILGAGLVATGLVFACVGDDPGGSAAEREGTEGNVCFANRTCLTSDLACVAGRCVLVVDGGGSGGVDAGPNGQDANVEDATTEPSDDGAACPGEAPIHANNLDCKGDTCAAGQVCCASAPGFPFVCIVETSCISPSLECEDSSQCGVKQCCLRPKATTRCGYEIDTTRCRDGCQIGELELCTKVTTCTDGTCKPIELTSGLSGLGSRLAGVCK